MLDLDGLNANFLLYRVAAIFKAASLVVSILPDILLCDCLIEHEGVCENLLIVSSLEFNLLLVFCLLDYFMLLALE